MNSKPPDKPLTLIEAAWLFTALVIITLTFALIWAAVDYNDNKRYKRCYDSCYGRVQAYVDYCVCQDDKTMIGVE